MKCHQRGCAYKDGKLTLEEVTFVMVRDIGFCWLGWQEEIERRNWKVGETLGFLGEHELVRVLTARGSWDVMGQMREES